MTQTIGRLFISGTACLLSLATFPAVADQIQYGCIDHDSIEYIVAYAKGTGGDPSAMYRYLNDEGFCGRIEGNARYIRVLDTFTDEVLGVLDVVVYYVTSGDEHFYAFGLVDSKRIATTK